MNADKSYIAERQAERRRQVRAGIAGVGVLMGLGTALLLSYPTPHDGLTARTTAHAATSPVPLDGTVVSALR